MGSQRWLYWALAMVPFVYIVYTLIIGMKDAVENDNIASEAVKSKIRVAQYMTVISWLTYPFVDIIPMCGVGLIVYTITNAKSEALGRVGEHAAINMDAESGEGDVKAMTITANPDKVVST